MLQLIPKNQMKLRHQSSTTLKKIYKWAMDSNSSWVHVKGTQVLLFLRWAPSFSGTCCSPLNTSACASEGCETVTETSVRGTERGNATFRKWHDRKVQQKEQWRPGDRFKVFPLPRIFMSLTTVPAIGKTTSIGPRDKTWEPVAEVIYWPAATPAPAHVCSSVCSTRVTKSRTAPLALLLIKHLLVERCGCYGYTMKAGVVHRT